MPHDDYDFDCCKESSIIVYHAGLTIPHCYRGTRNVWESAERNGYFRCNDSYMIVGAVAD